MSSQAERFCEGCGVPIDGRAHKRYCGRPCRKRFKAPSRLNANYMPARLLAYLQDNGARSPEELAEALDMTPERVYFALLAHVRQKHIERVYVITPAGEALLADRAARLAKKEGRP